MKYIIAVMLALSMLLSSCHKENEPMGETLLPVEQSYLPATTVFRTDDKEWVDKIKDYAGKEFIVNSKAEMEQDPFGFSNAYNGIDFDSYTLLLAYQIHDYAIDTYVNRYYFDNVERSYNWMIRVGTGSKPGESSDECYFTRYSILVKKIPADAEVKIQYVVGALNWDW